MTSLWQRLTCELNDFASKFQTMGKPLSWEGFDEDYLQLIRITRLIKTPPSFSDFFLLDHESWEYHANALRKKIPLSTDLLKDDIMEFVFTLFRGCWIPSIRVGLETRFFTLSECELVISECESNYGNRFETIRSLLSVCDSCLNSNLPSTKEFWISQISDVLQKLDFDPFYRLEMDYLRGHLPDSSWSRSLFFPVVKNFEIYIYNYNGWNLKLS